MRISWGVGPDMSACSRDTADGVSVMAALEALIFGAFRMGDGAGGFGPATDPCSGDIEGELFEELATDEDACGGIEVYGCEGVTIGGCSPGSIGSE